MYGKPKGRAGSSFKTFDKATDRMSDSPDSTLLPTFHEVTGSKHIHHAHSTSSLRIGDWGLDRDRVSGCIDFVLTFFPVLTFCGCFAVTLFPFFLAQAYLTYSTNVLDSHPGLMKKVVFAMRHPHLSSVHAPVL